jgi:hypothetical protein
MMKENGRKEMSRRTGDSMGVATENCNPTQLLEDIEKWAF